MTWKDALNKVRRNAVVLFPVLLAATDAALQQPKWQDALYVAAGVVLRQFFTSPTHEVQARVAAAEADAFLRGLTTATPGQD